MTLALFCVKLSIGKKMYAGAENIEPNHFSNFVDHRCNPDSMRHNLKGAFKKQDGAY